MTFKVGDKVRLKEDCVLMTLGSSYNPTDTIGIIVNDDLSNGTDYRYKVKWDTGITNGRYSEKDLESWYLQPLNKLKKRLLYLYDNNKCEGDDATYLGYVEGCLHLLEEGGEFGDYHKEFCREVWEKHKNYL